MAEATMNPLIDFSWQTLHLLRPVWLGLLPLWWLFLLYLYRQGGSAAAWQRVCDPELFEFLKVGQQAQRQAAWWWLLAVVGSILVLAMAGPTWKELAQPVYRQSSAVVVLLDVSRSMDAQDVKPSRLQRAKQKLQDILADRQEGQTALIVFAGEAFVVTPLTDDVATIAAQLQSISSDMMPVQGSAPDKAIQKAINLLHQARVGRGHVLLIGDELPAANHEPMKQAITQLQQAGHTFSTLAVGSSQGAPIPLANGGFVKDQRGNIVIPHLDNAPFHTWAQAGGGVAATMRLDDGDIQQLQNIWNQQTKAHYKQAETATFSHDQWREDGPLLLLILLPFIALAFRRGWLVVVLTLLCVPHPVQAMDWTTLWLNQDQQGQRLLQQDRYADAAKTFDDPQWKAAAAYQAGDYQQASRLLQGVDTAEGHYNRGNALAKMGKLDEAIAAYDACLKLQHDHADAKYNKKLLEDQKKQQQSKDKQQDSKDDKQGEQKKQGDEQGKQSSQDGKKQASQEGKQGEQGKQQGSQDGAQNKQDPSSQSQENKGSMNQQGSKEDEKQAMAEQAKRDAEQQKEAQQQQQAATADDKQEAAKQEQTMMPQQAKPSDAESLQKLETQQAYEQFLRRVPDDPGGLLRRKFLYQYQQQNPSPSTPQEQKTW